ncbi:hypothetical protein [Rhizobium chutanense]|uniref:Uncharacterized protein n=1 Tax=Rhizobium chutanense TaxID=2035448 RepID=A0A3S0SA71_9HYPH|nr:hypothetical protein [Rhizobium chutanense]RUM02146.1 hypothetical protein EFR84_21710 [Rhizobium chutanense]
MGKLWQKITYHRHRSELFALRLALRAPLLAPLLIGAVVVFWWCIASMPVYIPIILVLESFGALGQMVLVMLAFVILFRVIPWFFGWYYIAASVMFGGTAAANARVEALAGAIHAYRARSV